MRWVAAGLIGMAALAGCAAPPDQVAPGGPPSATGSVSAVGSVPAEGSGPAGVAPVVAPLVLDPVVPGWSPARSVPVAAVYDVPPSWLVLPEARTVGRETAPGAGVAATGAAEFGAGVCGDPDPVLALAGVMYETGSDLDLAARSAARAWGHYGFLDDRDRPPTLTVGPAERITTLAGQPAAVVRLEVRTAPRGRCKLTRGTVHAVAAAGYRGEYGPIAILVVAAEAERPDAVPEADIRRILGTLRPE